MTERIARAKQYLEDRKHRQFRRELTEQELDQILPVIYDRSLSYQKRHTLRLCLFLDHETPVLLPDVHVQGLRTLISFPDIFAPGELDEIWQTHYVHEKGKVTNLTWDVQTVLQEGMEGRRARLLNGKKQDEEFVECTIQIIDAVETFADRYARAITEAGDAVRGSALSRSVRYGAQTMEEAFQLFRMLHFVLWCSDCYHNTVGRFDQWLLPFYRHDLEAGLHTKETALEAIEDFFLSFNWDSDLYYSLAWGDNGQSLVLGGMLPDGSDGTNELTELALTAAKELRQIDPKINLRVCKTTPLEVYEKGTELTKIGLGFPQYSNDDVVIPCLEHWGYAPEDARNYTLAACWEFIVPEVAMDIPNIGGLPIAQVVRDTIEAHLCGCENFGQLMEQVRRELRCKAEEMAESVRNLFLEPAPFMSLLMRDCLENGRDISYGAKYNNYGFHGTGLSCGADQLAAVDQYVFREKSLSPQQLLEALEHNFEEDKPLQWKLRNEAEKMGRDAAADAIGSQLLDMFADALEGLQNERGGIFRGGTGTAMYYVWHGEKMGATADGRDAYDYLPANFSPSLFLTRSGPLSVLKGFSPDSLLRTCNGGPMTLELHDTVFKEPENTRKVAQLVQAYILSGGHQLQLNAVNREKLRSAQIEPEKHKDLIVRVWGWSGHFVELDKCYQDQVLRRVEFGI